MCVGILRYGDNRVSYSLKITDKTAAERNADDNDRVPPRWFLRGGAPREILPEKAISNPNFELELTLRQLPFRDDENVRSVLRNIPMPRGQTPAPLNKFKAPPPPRVRG